MLQSEHEWFKVKKIANSKTIYYIWGEKKKKSKIIKRLQHENKWTTDKVNQNEIIIENLLNSVV